VLQHLPALIVQAERAGSAGEAGLLEVAEHRLHRRSRRGHRLAHRRPQAHDARGDVPARQGDLDVHHAPILDDPDGNATRAASVVIVRRLAGCARNRLVARDGSPQARVVTASGVVGRPLVLVTGVGRAAGIGAAVALRLASDGWDVATTGWAPYDERMPWRHSIGDVERIGAAVRATGARTIAVSEDLSDVAAPERLFTAVESALGPVTALVLCHCESVDSALLDTTVESFDRHYAVNVRASWLLLQQLAKRFQGPPDRGRIIALTSDHTVGNLPYGATKGALDRLVLAAARELASLRICCNVVNPGPVDTGWMTDELRTDLLAATPHGRLGQPSDTAALVSFLCSEDGGWINGQLLHSDGGLHA
jgi:3-oxoacyl-[acyl-carrier protein] reductase